jgi:hypothetical protein
MDNAFDETVISGGVLGCLALVGSALKIGHSEENDCECDRTNIEGSARGKVTDEHGCATADDAEHIQT